MLCITLVRPRSATALQCRGCLIPSILSQGLHAALMLCCPTGGEWEEPWDQQSALDTIHKLERHWYQLDGNDSTRGIPAEAAEQFEGGSSEDEGPPRKQLKPSVNKVCPHVACSAQPVCLVEQLQTVRSHYRGRVDQFRIKVESLKPCRRRIRLMWSSTLMVAETHQLHLSSQKPSAPDHVMS